MLHARSTTIAILLLSMASSGSLYGQVAQEAAEVQEAPVQQLGEEAAIVEEEGDEGDLVEEDIVFEAVAQALVNDMPLEQADPQIVILWQYVNTECGLARRACDLTAEQRQQLDEIDRNWLRQKLQNPPEAGQLKILQGIGRFLGGRVNAPQRQDELDGVKRVRKLVDEQLASILNDEQKQVFQSEKDARTAFRQEALAGVLVAAFDKQIYVRQEQRVKLTDALSEWASGKNLFWQFYFQNESYVPNIPNSILRKCLGQQQVSTIQSLNTYNYEMDEIQFQMGGFQEAIQFVELVEESAGEEAANDE